MQKASCQEMHFVIPCSSGKSFYNLCGKICCQLMSSFEAMFTGHLLWWHLEFFSLSVSLLHPRPSHSLSLKFFFVGMMSKLQSSWKTHQCCKMCQRPDKKRAHLLTLDLRVTLLKWNLMKKAEQMMLAWTHRHTRVMQHCFCTLTSKAPDNLCWVAFHKTKITRSSYIIYWLIASVRTSRIMNVYHSHTVEHMTLLVQKMTMTTCSFELLGSLAAICQIHVQPSWVLL